MNEKSSDVDLNEEGSEIFLKDSPILTKQSSRSIDGIDTQVITFRFEDRILILITQFGKVGNLTQVNLPISKLKGYNEPIGIVPESEDGQIPALPKPDWISSIESFKILGSSSSSSTRTTTNSEEKREEDDEFELLIEVYINQISMIVFTGFEPCMISTRSKKTREGESFDDEEVKLKGDEGSEDGTIYLKEDDQEVLRSGDDLKPIVIGLALRRRNRSGSERDQKVEEREVRSGLIESERLRFGTIMQMIYECKVW